MSLVSRPVALAFASVLLAAPSCRDGHQASSRAGATETGQTYAEALELICTAPERVEGAAEAPPNERAVLIATWLGKRLDNPQAIALMKTLSYEAPEARSARLLREAAANGVERCPIATMVVQPTDAASASRTVVAPPDPAGPAPSVTPPAPTSTGTVATPVRLSVTVSPQRSGIQQPVEINYTLTNVGTEPLTLNGRMLYDRGSAPQPYREVFLDIQGPEGYVNTIAFRRRVGPAGADQLVEVAPGATFTKTQVLTEFESLDEPGTYRLTASYENVSEAEAGGRPAWRGLVSAEPITLERY